MSKAELRLRTEREDIAWGIRDLKKEQAAVLRLIDKKTQIVECRGTLAFDKFAHRLNLLQCMARLGIISYRSMGGEFVYARK